MRLRSSQFVFLLLLVCSVRQWESAALQPSPGSSAHAAVFAHPQIVHGSSTASTYLDVAAHPLTSPVRLDSAAVAARRTAWTMRRPAQASATVATFTGLLRA